MSAGSSVQCSSTDTDITRCQFEGADDIENTCSHAHDVTLRCYDVTWAGVRFGVPSKKNILKNVQVERAGLVDYSTYTFGPGKMIDEGIRSSLPFALKLVTPVTLCRRWVI